MRNIILGLVLANILVLAWTRWVAPSEVADPTRLAAPATEARLVLYRRNRTAPSPAVGRAAPPVVAADGTGRCERIGPFMTSETAVSIGGQLGARGLSVDLTSEPGSIWVGHWVQVVNLASGTLARRAVNDLVDAGLVDAYIVQTDPTYNISLGVFRGREGADRVMRIAREAGLETQRLDRYRAGTQYWVNVTLHGDDALDLTSLQLDRTQILRSEPVGCGVELDSIGEAESDSIESVAQFVD